MSLISPKEFFSFEPGTAGEFINWPDMVRYFETLSEASPRVAVRHMGLSSDGNPFIAVFISAEETIAQLDYYRDISMRLSNPKDAGEKEIEALCEAGKAVCFQMTGLHAYELSYAQASPTLAYTLAAGEDRDTLEILNNTILILVPSANPDGLIDCWHWNETVRGTGHNRFFSPHIYAKYSGHGNARDAVYENLIESRYINQLVFREWMPQVLVDQHHGYAGGPLFHFGAAPTSSEIALAHSPLLIREMQLLTADVAYDMQTAGLRDVASNATSYQYGYSFQDTARAHNISGLLAELLDTTFTADAFMRMDSRTHRGTLPPDRPTGLRPDPVSECAWTRKDAEKYAVGFELALLRACARNRKRLLRGMAIKARQQTERGAQDSEQAYLIPPVQHDPSALRRVVGILLSHRVELYRAQEPLKIGQLLYPAGTLVVPLAQPKYALVKNLLHVTRTAEEDCRTGNNESEITTLNLGLLMGVEIHPANAKIEGALSPVTEPPAPAEAKLPLPACENDSYLTVNRLLNAGSPVFYDEAENAYTGDSGEPLRRAKIGLFKLSRFIYFRWDQVSNDENPYTALLLDRYGFDWRYVADKEIREGVPEDIDILIIPGEWRTALEQGDEPLEEYPEEYTCGLGKLGARRIREFVERGGRLIAWNSAAGWAISALKLRIQDGKTLFPNGVPYWERHPGNSLYGDKKQLSRAELCVCGPTLKALLRRDRLTRGMPDQLPILAEDSGPVMRVCSRMEDFPFSVDYETIVRYAPKEELHVSGEVRGLRFLADASCVVRTQIKKGEVILYSFDPKFRAQTGATFKLLFNALYL